MKENHLKSRHEHKSGYRRQLCDSSNQLNEVHLNLKSLATKVVSAVCQILLVYLIAKCKIGLLFLGPLCCMEPCDK